MKLRSKIGYGIGDMGAGILWGMVSNFILVYMTDAVGMAAAAVGTIILFTRVFDGVSDALMGTIIDNTRTKLGKAKPWYLGSIVPLVVNSVLLFNIPKSIPEKSQQIYFFVLYFTMTVIFYTIKDVSYNALPALVTDSTKDRISMNIYRYAFSLSTAIVVSAVTIPVINVMGGIGNQEAWTKVVMVFAVIGLVTLTVSALSIKEINIDKNPSKEAKTKSKLPFYKAFAYTFTNRYFIIMLVSTLMGMTRLALMAAGVYYATYVLGNAELVGLLYIASIFPMMLGMFLGTPLINKLGMQKARNAGNIVSFFGALLAAVFASNFAIVIVGISLLALGLGPSTATSSAMLSHVAEYSEWKYHAKLQGTTFSCNSVATKLGTGIGGALIGWGLQAGGYVAGAAVQSSKAIFMITGVYLYLPVLLCAVSLVLNFFLDIEYKMPGIKEELAQRNS
jgi:GPH family glycoside/pentoside/hexuronide:cation symporter